MTVRTTLIYSKPRVASLKIFSLFRLELYDALLLSRLLKKLRLALFLKINHQYL